MKLLTGSPRELLIDSLQGKPLSRMSVPTSEPFQVDVTSMPNCGTVGLDPAGKALRVKICAVEIHYGVCLIAYSCGAHHLRSLKR